MEQSSKAKKPCTPARERFFDLFKPSIALGKRNRNVSSDDMADTANNPHSSPVANNRLKLPVSIALQNEDEDLDETIIVTALETIPFCCHEDLLTMTRDQLLAVAEALNAKLPAALRIDIKPSSTDNFIRNAIELIVGIKRTVPGAPKAVKLGLSTVADPDKSVSPPTSPLATKTRPRDAYQASPRLAVLKEEDEETATMVHERPVKKKKLSPQADVPVTKKRRVSAQVALSVRWTRNAASTTSAHKTGLNRTRSQRIPTSQISPPRSSRILRSHSQKLPAEMKNMEIDTTFITMKRPQYRFRHELSGSITNTSTLTKGVFKNGPLFAQRDCKEDSPEETDQEGFSTSTSNTSNERSPSSTSAPFTTGHTTPRGNIVWARREAESEAVAWGSNADEDEDSDVTFGLHGMTMATPSFLLLATHISGVA